MQPAFQKNSAQEFELFWSLPAYFSAQLEAHLKNRSQWQALSVSENMTLVNTTWGQRESKLA